MNCRRCKDKNFLIECACGCGRHIFLKYRGSNHTRRYIKGHQARRELHYDYKGRHVNFYGYVCLFRPDHHFADANGYVREHRIFWEEANGAVVLPYGVIHHINGDKQDNRLENLKPMSSRQHKSLHGKTGNFSMPKRLAALA